MNKKGPIVNPELKADLTNIALFDLGDVVTPYSGSSQLAIHPIDPHAKPAHPTTLSNVLDLPANFEVDDNLSGIYVPSNRKHESGETPATTSPVTSITDIRKPERGFKMGSQRLEEAHQRLQTGVAAALAKGIIPFCVGGSNDQSLPNASALLLHATSTKGAKVAVINIDAHLDVRPRVFGREHSGSPFRRLLKNPGFDGSMFVEFAAQGMQCSADHAKFVEENNGQIYWLSQLRAKTYCNGGKSIAEQFSDVLADLVAKGATHIFVSFDIDSVDLSYAPGVSCPSPTGLTGAEAMEIALAAGKNSVVSMMDLSELCPVVEGYHTPLLASYIFYHFSLGVAARVAAE